MQAYHAGHHRMTANTRKLVVRGLALSALALLTACTATSKLDIPQSQSTASAPTTSAPTTTPSGPGYVVACKMIHAYGAWVPKVTVTNNGSGTLYLPDQLGGGPDNGPLAFTVEFLDSSGNEVSTDTQDSENFGPVSATIAAGQSQSFKTFSAGGTFAETPQLDQSGTSVTSCAASISGGVSGQNDGF